MVTTYISPMVERARAAAAAVEDPEIPVLTIEDLGILRDVRVDEIGVVTAVITPTYSGCPAVEAIAEDVERALHDAGFVEVEVERALAPAWTSDWISETGLRKLAEYGIAPPSHTRDAGPMLLSIGVRCPRCGATRTAKISNFGATACKSLWRCRACKEVFEHFKPI